MLSVCTEKSNLLLPMFTVLLRWSAALGGFDGRAHPLIWRVRQLLQLHPVERYHRAGWRCMTVFDLDRYVVREYERFARSFTDIHAGDLNTKIAGAYASNKFWPEPMIQINPRFKTGGTVGQLVKSGDLAPGIDKIFRSAEPTASADTSLHLHQHQLDAVTLANQGKSFVVATGTGSGKSLCFFIPIIDQILRAKARGEPQRTRAVVIYPMTALANSQLEELHKRISGSG